VVYIKYDLVSFHDVTTEQAQAVTQYLLFEYGDFAGITTPGFNTFGSYDIFGRMGRMNYSAFENNGNLTERILNWNFNTISFAPNDMGELWLIRFKNADLSDKIGDFPIITAEQAQEMLLAGKYITTVPYEFSGEESIAHVELIYRNTGRDEVFMPYYKFLIEYESDRIFENEGIRGFGAYYVPAVHSDYWANTPVWSGSFN
jgi:hypothetical protein